MNFRPSINSLLGACAVLAMPAVSPAADKFNQPPRVPLQKSGDTSSRAAALRRAIAAGDFHFTPKLADAYLLFAIDETGRELSRTKVRLPADFLHWVKSDPVVRETVYGTRSQPLRTLLWLHSLELDLGRETVRKEYTQLALAMAVVAAAAEESLPDLEPREPLKLEIPEGQPNAPVDTKAKGRKLDRDDHIVNFFKDHAKITAPAIGGKYKALPELEYDSNGIARSLTQGDTKGDAAGVLREVTPADLLASRALQVEFNDYMEQHGVAVSVDCGDGVIHPAMKDRNSIRQSPHHKGIVAAYTMFREAFEKKGLLAVRDTPATPAERCAYLIRNDRETRTKPLAGNPPTFPLTSPWPTLTLLAADKTPLREREALRRDFIATGKLHTYGEYIGPIAQDFTLQSARRLTPYGFGYGSVQMMLKDGGVCGTMANICVASFTMLGVPACPAGQPGHCAVISMQCDKQGKFQYVGKQYATGGDEVTRPATPWVFADTDVRRDMIFNQAIAWAMNAGFAEFLDTQIAYNLFRMMPEKDRQLHATVFLGDALALNPFNISLVEAGFGAAPTSKAALDHFATVKRLAEAAQAKAGAKPLYLRRAAQFADARIRELPGDPAMASRVTELRDYLEATRPRTKEERQAEREAARQRRPR